MSVFFAMIGPAGNRRPAFYLTAKSAPKGAVEISDARHGELLDAQAEGRTIIADENGRPKIKARPRPSAESLRARLRSAIRAEAAARIRAISPEWRQMNDLREPSDAGAVRFARIDAIRAASDAMQDFADRLPAADLTGFPVTTHTLWPEFD